MPFFIGIAKDEKEEDRLYNIYALKKNTITNASLIKIRDW